MLFSFQSATLHQSKTSEKSYIENCIMMYKRKDYRIYYIFCKIYVKLITNVIKMQYDKFQIIYCSGKATKSLRWMPWY